MACLARGSQDAMALSFAQPGLLREHLLRERIFPAIHWERLPSPAADFPAEHELAASVLTLPCDQRYSGEHMERVAAVFEDAMR